MREEDSNWFARWEEELPTPDELMPLSQTLITPDLALAFDIPNQLPETPPPHLPPPSSHPSSTEFDSCGVELGSPGNAGDGPARTLKRPRLVWTPQLHKRFVDAVAHLGIKNAVPKTIMQLMSVDGLTRENVASHLQKYRLYLKRMQGLSAAAAAGGVGGLSPAAASSDPATDHLFASSPVPPHFLHPGRNADHFMPFVPVATHHQLQIAAAAAAAVPRPQLLQQQEQQQYHHNRQVGHLPPLGGQFEHPFQMTSSHQAHMVGLPVHHSMHASYVDDLELTSAATGGGRKVLTLFPVGDD